MGPGDKGNASFRSSCPRRPFRWIPRPRWPRDAPNPRQKGKRTMKTEKERVKRKRRQEEEEEEDGDVGFVS